MRLTGLNSLIICCVLIKKLEETFIGTAKGYNTPVRLRQFPLFQKRCVTLKPSWFKNKNFGTVRCRGPHRYTCGK